MKWISNWLGNLTLKKMLQFSTADVLEDALAPILSVTSPLPQFCSPIFNSQASLSWLLS